MGANFMWQSGPRAVVRSMTPEALEQEWKTLLTMLPSDLERRACATGALRRRREVKSAADLVRLAFVYGLCDFSLRATASWAQERGLANLSDVAVLKRLKNAAPFLSELLTQQLAARTLLPSLGVVPPTGPVGVRRVRLVDATCASRPGATGTDWRVHLGFDLPTLCIDHAELTDASGGETFCRLPILAGDLLVGDRGYSHRRGLVAVAGAKGHVIVRLNWHNVPLQDRTGRPLDLLATLATLAPGEVGEWSVQTAPHPKEALPAVEGRVIAVAKTLPEAEAARRRLRQQAKKKGKTVSPSTLAAAGYFFVFTTLAPAQLAARAVLELYRFRWQIELLFKRLKGLLAFEELTAKDEALCRATLLTKLLGALLVDALSGEALRGVAFSPWGERALGSEGQLLAGLPAGGGHVAAGHRGGLDPGAVAHARATARRRPARAAPRTLQPSTRSPQLRCSLPLSPSSLS